MEVPSLPFLVADADAVGDGQGRGVWFVSDVQQLELVEQRSPGRNIWLSEREQRTRASAGPSPQQDGFPGTLLCAPSLSGEVHVHAADRVCVFASAASPECDFYVCLFFLRGWDAVIDLERSFSGLDRSSPIPGDWKSTCSALLESVEIRGEVTLK